MKKLAIVFVLFVSLALPAVVQPIANGDKAAETLPPDPNGYVKLVD